MSALRIILTIVFIIICIALSAIVLMQEGKSAGLGSISGAADRSMEGAFVKITRGLAIAFIIIAAILNMNRF